MMEIQLMIFPFFRVITRPEDVKQFFSDSHTHNKAASSNAGWLFSQILGDCLGLISGDRWVRVRHAFDPFFTPKISAQRLPHVIAAGERYLDELHSYSLETETSITKFTVNGVAAFQRFPFFYVAEIIYGPLNVTDRADMWKLAGAHTSVFRHLVQGGIHRYKATKFFSTSAYKETSRFLDLWREFNIKLSQRQLQEGCTSPLTELLAAAEQSNVTLDEVSDSYSWVARWSLASTVANRRAPYQGSAYDRRVSFRESGRHNTCSDMVHRITSRSHGHSGHVAHRDQCK
jgi:hypothetical protein